MAKTAAPPRPYQDSKDLIYFEKLINELSTVYKTDKRDASDMLLSNYRMSKSDPSDKGILRCYKFTSKDGFKTDEFFEEQCVEFLSRIADGYEYSEDPIPGHEGYYNVRKGRNFLYPDDEDVWYGNYELFGFRRSEVVNFFPALEMVFSDISGEIDDAGDTVDDTPVSTEIVAETWHGKETAWKLIAGLAIALSKTDKDYIWGTSPNVSKICAQAATFASEFGEDHVAVMEIDNLRKLLSSALKRHTPKLKPKS
ncbi:TPA: hypothetical protein NVL63_001602 [Klebsiella pneumoniae]|nr:hypothetical protein [Klebsiella pneumoniae]